MIDYIRVHSARGLEPAISAACTRCSVFGDCVVVQYDTNVIGFLRDPDTHDICVIAQPRLFRVQYGAGVIVAAAVPTKTAPN